MHHWFDELVYAGPLIHQRRAYAVYLDGCETAAEERQRPQCARCGKYNHPLHVCGLAEAMAAMAPAMRKAVEATRPPTPAKNENIASEPPPSGWREREPLT